MRRTEWDMIFPKFCLWKYEENTWVLKKGSRVSHQLSSLPQNVICCLSTILLFFFGVLTFFSKKRKPTNSSAIELRKRRIFCRSLLYFQSFSRNTAKKVEWQQQFVVFSPLFLIKNIFCWEGKWAFFRIHYGGEKKNYWVLKWVEIFILPLLPPPFWKKHISAIKNVFLLFPRNDKRRANV